LAIAWQLRLVINIAQMLSRDASARMYQAAPEGASDYCFATMTRWASKLIRSIRRRWLDCSRARWGGLIGCDVQPPDHRHRRLPRVALAFN
jgi:hypothetical protein